VGLRRGKEDRVGGEGDEVVADWGVGVRGLRGDRCAVGRERRVEANGLEQAVNCVSE
jgi:hypothetical protein